MTFSGQSIYGPDSTACIRIQNFPINSALLRWLRMLPSECQTALSRRCHRAPDLPGRIQDPSVAVHPNSTSCDTRPSHRHYRGFGSIRQLSDQALHRDRDRPYDKLTKDLSDTPWTGLILGELTLETCSQSLVHQCSGHLVSIVVQPG